MTYANVKCEECGLIMPQNEAMPADVSNAAVVATNDLSFGLTGERSLRLWQQGDRTYTHNKRVFYCSNCYATHAEALTNLPSEPRPHKLLIFIKMLLINLLYTFVRGAFAGVFKLPPSSKTNSKYITRNPAPKVYNTKTKSHYGNRNKTHYKNPRT